MDEAIATTSLDWANRLNGILDYLTEAIKGTTDFVADQAPEVVQQLLAWKMFQFGGLAVAFLIVMFVMIKIWWRPYKNFKNLSDDAQFGTGMIMFFTLAPFIGFVLTGLQAMKIWIAPKVYLIEYIASLLVKNGN